MSGNESARNRPEMVSSRHEPSLDQEGGSQRHLTFVPISLSPLWCSKVHSRKLEGGRGRGEIPKSASNAPLEIRRELTGKPRVVHRSVSRNLLVSELGFHRSMEIAEGKKACRFSIERNKGERIRPVNVFV